MTDLEKAKERFNQCERGFDSFDEMIEDARQCYVLEPIEESEYIALMQQFNDWPENELKAMYAEITTPVQ